jgi:putative glutamine amidotransferase
MKPIIGLTMHAADKMSQINDVYIQSIIQAGGIPICLPIIAGEDVIPVINKIDGLCLIGGYDIDPRFFEQEPHPNIGVTVKNRDESELAYFYEAFDRDMPILGICRGLQLINVALGGTLIQDIPSQKPDAICHKQQSARMETSHKVKIFPGKLLEITGLETIFVNSFHHQAVDRVAEELIETAVSADGIVEALEHPAKKYCLSVQWHPEELAMVKDEYAMKLFKSFIEAC